MTRFFVNKRNNSNEIGIEKGFDLSVWSDLDEQKIKFDVVKWTEGNSLKIDNKIQAKWTIAIQWIHEKLSEWK